MNNTITLKTLCGITIAISGGLTLSQPAFSQCSAGAGTTLQQIASRHWGRYVAPLEVSLPPGVPNFQNPTRMASDGSLVAVADQGSRFIYEFNPDGQIAGNANGTFVTHTTSTPAILQFAAGYLWVVTIDGHVLTPFAPGSPTNLVAGPNPADMIYDGEYIWISNGSGVLYQVTLPTAAQVPVGSTIVGTPAAVTPVTTGETGLQRLAFDGRYLWAVANGNELIKFDPSTNTVVARVPLRAAATSLIFDGAYLWAGSSGSAGLISKIDPITTNAVATYSTSAGANDLAFDGTYIWATKSFGNAITRLRACDGAILGDTAVAAEPANIVFSGSSMFVTYQNSKFLSVR